MKWRNRRGKKFLPKPKEETKRELTPEEIQTLMVRKYAKKVTGSPYIRIEV